MSNFNFCCLDSGFSSHMHELNMSGIALLRSPLNSGAFIQTDLPRPALNSHLCTDATKSRRHLQCLDSRSSCSIVARPLGLLEFGFARNISVFCSHGSASGPADSWVPQEGSQLREDETGNGVANAGDNSSSQEERQPPTWDLQSRHKRLQAIAARSVDPLQDSMSTVGRKLQNYLDRYRKPKSKEMPHKLEWDWERWRDHFTAVEEQENLASALKFQLEDAVANERFEEAARLKTALRAATVDDPVSEVLNELKKALKEEKYEQAAKLRDDAAVGLVGWWMAMAEDGSDPYGCIINITAGHGKFVAVGYTARQLASALPGTPLLEVFIRKDSEGYHQQVVYLQPDERAGNLVAKTPKSIDVNIDKMNALVGEEEEVKAKDPLETVRDEKEKSRDAALMDEGLCHIINFLKERIPNMNLKVFKVTTPNADGIPKIVEQLFDKVVAQDADNASGHKEIEVSLESRPDEADDRVGESSDSEEEDEKETFSRFIAGGMLQTASEDSLPKVPTRVPARIEYRSRDSLLFYIEENMTQQMPANESLSSGKVIAISTQASVDVPPDVAKVVWNLEKIPVKMSNEVAEFLNLAMRQAPNSYYLSKCTSFERIKLMDTTDDPLNGLYIGAFGPYTSEVIQLRQKYGSWHGEEYSSNSKNRIAFFKYVEAVKLTGDLNVPAGQVTFRAKTGRENRLSCHGVYPEELGVVARYSGQGRLAEPGFKNPEWIDGELLLFDRKGIGGKTGAELGFVYILPEQHLLVLFNQLKLQV